MDLLHRYSGAPKEQNGIAHRQSPGICVHTRPSPERAEPLPPMNASEFTGQANFSESPASPIVDTRPQVLVQGGTFGLGCARAGAPADERDLLIIGPQGSTDGFFPPVCD